MRSILVSFVLVVAVTVSCKEEEEPRQSAPADATTTGYLQTAVSDLGAVSGVATDSATAGTAQGTLSNLYNSYNSMTQYTLSTTQAEGQAMVPYAETVSCSVSGSYTWDTSLVTYDNCDGLTGTISWSGDTFTIDISYDFSAFSMGGYTGQMTYTGELTISDTAINGNLDLAYDLAIDSMGYSITYTSDMAITYDNVALDATGCPSGGALDLEGNYAYDAAGQTYDSAFHITYQFNACDDVTVLY
jgi:hypothetical protein